MIPYGSHSIDAGDINAVVDVLENAFLTQGQQVPLFEKNLCDYTGARYAVAVNSGTSALHLACIAAGIGKGDRVWTSPNSFAASANCALYCGADVDFVDIDPRTRNMSVALLAEKLVSANANGTLPKAIVVVHFAGSSCDMEAIHRLTSCYGIIIIEDAAHGLGGKDKSGHPIGACKFSDMAVMSFHPVKSMTTAEGGAVLTNNESLANNVRLHASHGITKNSKDFSEQEQGNAWFYSQQSLGFNYRLSDLHAALGNSQIKRLDSFIAARRAKAEVYHQALASLPIELPERDANSAWHLYTIELTMHDRKKVFDELRDRGVGVNVHYIPIYHHVYYKNLGYSADDYPNCERYYNNTLTLPLYSELTADMQNSVIDILHEVLK
ncbi:UDP-4-amino-4,6-dideoxy-N-acetyl-beta-L-altrosamine transaminase [Alteromonas sp. KUL49]|uniref:UDP-4-amino-4, 6-dideoxy-N-acetyl-beta-L-altrosamine transaminase n=1 Tax=Alteromonas sp. KUL49 TaxID=2480798 RepID=UPI00102ED965|nr:UDP-4-amino-4,6-dideoxy-N-acetyl-beta-L-altrosamine transaminase [Alteromonas sp. KUL49]TAP39667.1 UDP-4-amino-4,6-dideoxy-N-acetyl-beta-L-altrosamine transaminase [Alteromonas sp. KUL49]GEA11653.1 UDP-4-amino-4,6-dideoxy-N-acetyl-beta-L-altrosami ne transaminase [Alteromonas sp. KUL49]